jgi:hypothetical protein
VSKLGGSFGERRNELRRSEDQTTRKARREHFWAVAVKRHPVLTALAVALAI